MRTRERVGLRMSHVVDVQETYDRTITRYRLQTEWTRRPAERLRHGVLECGYCGEAVRLRVYGVAATRWRKFRRLAWVPPLVAVIMLAVMRIVDIERDDAESELSGLFPTFCAALAVCGLITAAVLYLIEDGVVLQRGQGGVHVSKPVGLLRAIRSPRWTETASLGAVVFDDVPA